MAANVVDSSAWLSYFAGDANADHFAQPIEALAQLLVPSVTLYEVFKTVQRQRDEAQAFEAIAHMQQGTVVDLDSELALNAAAYSTTLKLPLADSIIYATAIKHQATIWTQDVDFKNLDGVRYYPAQTIGAG